MEFSDEAMSKSNSPGPIQDHEEPMILDSPEDSLLATSESSDEEEEISEPRKVLVSWLCINPDCPEKKLEKTSLRTATRYILAKFGYEKSEGRKRKVCLNCYDQARGNINKIMSNQLFEDPIKAIMEVMEVDDSEDEETDASDDSEFELDSDGSCGIDSMPKSIENIIEKFVSKQTDKAITDIRENILSEATVKEFDQKLTDLERETFNMRRELYNKCDPLNIAELQSIHIDGDSEEEDSIPPPQSPGSPESEHSSTEGKMALLPPKGPLDNPPVQVGDSAFALRQNNQKQWWPCTVVENLPGSQEYTIKFDNGNSQKCRIVIGKDLAYSSEAKYMLQIGTRCIAMVKEAFFGAIIAEQPNLDNRNRYLVFFDDGKASYLSHDRVRLVVKPSEEVWKDVPVKNDLPLNYQLFIKIYLTKIKEMVRPRLRLIVGDDVETEKNGEWSWARVRAVDGLLVKMEFYNGTMEWLYKGSPRFRPMWLHTQELLGRTAPRARKKEKKEVTNWESKGSEISSEISREPPPWEPHDCDWKCISGPGLAYKDGDYKGENLLLIPISRGWRRQVYNAKEEENSFVIYVAPCGRRLRSLDEVFTYLKLTASEMEIDFFNCDWWVHAQNEFKLEKTFVHMKDMSFGKENIPVPLVNSVGGEYHDYFQYSTKRLPQKNVYIEEDVNFLVCCSCEDDCKDKEKCECWQLTIQSTQCDEENEVDNTVGYRFKRLPEQVSTGIYECNSRCRCKHTCLNRVAQQPLRNKLQVFKTAKRGWGIRTLVDLPQGTFLCTYVGKLFELSESVSSGKEIGDEYHAELDLIEQLEDRKGGYESDVTDIEDDEEPPKILENCFENGTKSMDKSQVDGMALDPEMEEVKPDPGDVAKKRLTSVRKLFGKKEHVYIMDAKEIGNIGRYLNHSCNPNVFVQNVFVDSHDLRFPWVAFFARAFIKAGDELFWSYNYEIGSLEGREIMCHCGSSRCKGRLL